MRLTLILAVVIAATLQNSSIALSATKDSKAMIENGVVVSAHADGGRLLRRVEKNPSGEERSVSDVGKWVKNLNPAKAARKVVQTAKIKKFLREEGERAAWLAEQAKKLSNE
ncbi:hypothetical protein PHYPSEUDO_013978 [Phytophthora pseudosyringae]|uniref:RxLR effector protein n=1 Tax=Phytophthora pseudosyringae TaxID=221518 RepID=A0A8T1W627_9STRA|nr:hypothetical protein PHYPSEUDO_013978 [Phytophthora pseudosyringae]